NIKVALFKNEELLFSETVSSSPENPYLKEIKLKEDAEAEEIKLVITDLNTGKELVSYQKEKETMQEIPTPAKAAKKPGEVENNDQLFLTGMHLEQYRHATYNPTDYYEEALRRDPKDSRCNNAMGLWYLRRGQFARSETFFKKAIETITERNPNPYDGESYYNLGWSLKMQNKNDAAFD